MKTEQNRFLLRISVVVTFVAMVVVNALANILPINGIESGAVSDLYANLFAPAGLTFTIWALIYLLLGMYSIYQLGLFQKKPETMPNVLLDKIAVFFTLSSLANLTWIFAWHYQVIWLSLILMLVIFVMLALIFIRIHAHLKANGMSWSERIFIRLPFSVYFGWITVATIANIITFLVSINFAGFGLSPVVWMVVIILVGMVIGVATILKHRDIAYGLVIVWAYSGILLKHTMSSGFNNQYPEVIWTVSGTIAILVAALIIAFIAERKKMAA